MHNVGRNQINIIFPWCPSGNVIVARRITKKTHQDRAQCTTLYFRGFNLGNGNTVECWSVNTHYHRSDFNNLENQVKHLPYEDQRMDHSNVTFYADTALKNGSAEPQQKHLQHQQNVKAIPPAKYPHRAVRQVVQTVQI